MTPEDKKFLEARKDILWYAKHHYKESDDRIDDLKHIMVKLFGASIEYVKDGDVYSVMVSMLLAAYSDKRHVMDKLFSDMFSPLVKHGKLEATDGTVTYKEIIHLILGQLSILQVKDDNGVLIDMGEPDYSILGCKEETS